MRHKNELKTSFETCRVSPTFMKSQKSRGNFFMPQRQMLTIWALICGKQRSECSDDNFPFFTRILLTRRQMMTNKLGLLQKNGKLFLFRLSLRFYCFPKSYKKKRGIRRNASKIFCKQFAKRKVSITLSVLPEKSSCRKGEKRKNHLRQIKVYELQSRIKLGEA